MRGVMVMAWSALALVGVLQTAKAQTPDAAAVKVDAFVTAEIEKRHIPGVSIAVVQEGRLILAKGYGLANVELSVPARAETVYEIGSITKQFTSAAIMMLVEEGKIELDEKITKYLSDLPAAWNEVTVRHLLTHTSGIKSYTGLPDFLKNLRNDYTHEELIKRVAALPLDFPPGEKWDYDNTGYFLLGMIIEKVSGKLWGDFLRERIFSPLGMTATRPNDLRDVIPNRANGYTVRNGTLQNAEFISMTQPFAAGVLVSTVLDMAKWDAALAGGKLLKPASYTAMWTPVTLKNGKTQEYGFGWAVHTGGVHKLIEHGGGIPGFTTHIARYVDDHLTVIAFTNTDSSDPVALTRGIAGIYVPALAPVADATIEDKDPAVTKLLKDVLADTVADKLDPMRFTPQMRALLFPDKVKEGAAFFKNLAPLQSVQLLERKQEDKNRSFRYRLVYKGGTVICLLTLNAEGKIAGLGFRPE